MNVLRLTILCLVFAYQDALVFVQPVMKVVLGHPRAMDRSVYRRPINNHVLHSTAHKEASEDASSTERVIDTSIYINRLPTSIQDQVRQAADSLKRATKDEKRIYRHAIRLLLPVIGATELDDWPGGARQMMEAADPLVEQILQQMTDYTLTTSSASERQSVLLQKFLLDPSDGVIAILAQAPTSAKDDSCTVLLPSADTIPKLKNLDDNQVGPERNLFLVNPQWKRRSDFGGAVVGFGLGGLFSGGGSNTHNANADYAETFVPTYSLTNLICEGESIRVLRTHPGPWRVFVRTIRTTNGNGKNDGDVDWLLVGTKEFESEKPQGWENLPENQRDGGKLFDYGQPTYREIIDMLVTSPNYTPKNPAERAAAAFDFIKDSF